MVEKWENGQEKNGSCCRCSKYYDNKHHVWVKYLFDLPYNGSKKNGNGNGNGNGHGNGYYNGNGNPFVIDLCYDCHHGKFGVSRFLEKEINYYQRNHNLVLDKEIVYHDLKHYVDLFLYWHTDFFGVSEQEILSWVKFKSEVNSAKKSVIKNKQDVVDFFSRNLELLTRSEEINSGKIFKRNYRILNCKQ